MTQADVLLDELSSEIFTLEDELVTLRSQRDELIETVNESSGKINDMDLVDWYVMEQFREPWKFRESKSTCSPFHLD